MQIGVVSDTHWRRAGQWSAAVERALEGVDLILHAGDVEEWWVLDRLEAIAPVQAVLGNCDSADLRALLPMDQVVEAESRRIGLLHGWDLNPEDPAALVARFPGMDLVVHGHTHVPVLYEHAGVAIFNPGSPSSPRNHAPPTVGRIAVEDGRLRAWHVRLL